MRPPHRTLNRHQVHRSVTNHLQQHVPLCDYKRKVSAPTLWAVLRLEGFDVLTASDGAEALHIIEGWTPSLVILDLDMPCLDGGSVLRELSSHAETRDTPVVVVTGADADRVADRGATVLHKPVTPEQLLPVIERQLKAA